MLIYRLISWLLIAAVGWVVFFFMFRTENEVDPDAVEADAQTDSGSGARNARIELPGDPDSAQLKNGNGAGPVDPVDAALQGPLPPPDAASETGETSRTRQRPGAAQS